MKPTILTETPITAAELKYEIDAIKKRDGELNYRAARTEEYLKVFKGLTKTKLNELKAKFVELNIPRLKDEHICKIIDLMPGSIQELKVILQEYTITVKEASQKDIVKLLDDYR